MLLFNGTPTLFNWKRHNVSDYIGNNHGGKPPHSHNTVVIADPFNNRKSIATHGKKLPGVYVLTNTVSRASYVGGSVNLYARVTSYFMPSIISSGERRIYRYLLKEGYANLQLTLHILPVGSTVTQITELEQFYINTLLPTLNVDPVAGGLNGFHEPMSQEQRDKLRKERGLVIYLYDTLLHSLVFVFESKTTLYSSINMHHKTLNKCLLLGIKYLNRFIFSYHILTEFAKDMLLSLQDVNILLAESRDKHVLLQPARKPIRVDNVLHPDLSREYDGINEFAKAIGGDRSTIRTHIDKGTLYRKQ